MNTEIGKLYLKSNEIRALETYIGVIEREIKVKGVKYSGPVSQKKIYKVAFKRSTSGEGSGTHFYFTYSVWKKTIRLHSEKAIDVIMRIPRPETVNVQVHLY